MYPHRSIHRSLVVSVLGPHLSRSILVSALVGFTLRLRLRLRLTGAVDIFFIMSLSEQLDESPFSPSVVDIEAFSCLTRDIVYLAALFACRSRLPALWASESVPWCRAEPH